MKPRVTKKVLPCQINETTIEGNAFIVVRTELDTGVTLVTIDDVSGRTVSFASEDVDELRDALMEHFLIIEMERRLSQTAEPVNQGTTKEQSNDQESRVLQRDLYKAVRFDGL